MTSVLEKHKRTDRTSTEYRVDYSVPLYLDYLSSRDASHRGNVDSQIAAGLNPTG